MPSRRVIMARGCMWQVSRSGHGKAPRRPWASTHCASVVLMQEEWRGEVIDISWSPRAFLFKGFLTEEETNHLIEKVLHHAPTVPVWAQ